MHGDLDALDRAVREHDGGDETICMRTTLKTSHGRSELKGKTDDEERFFGEVWITPHGKDETGERFGPEKSGTFELVPLVPEGDMRSPNWVTRQELRERYNAAERIQLHARRVSQWRRAPV